ncbi:MAG: antitoxin [Streptosporangiaceae bacterium]
MTFTQKIMDLLGKNADKVGPAVDKAGDMIDKKTGNKYKNHVDTAQKAAKDAAAKAAAQRQRPTSNS